MQIGHQLRHVAVGGDQVVGHVVGVAGGVADAVQPRQVAKRADQVAEPRLGPVQPLAVPAVDVLAQEGDLPHAAGDEIARLGEDARGRTAGLGPARVGNDAEGAELVATLLHGQEGRRRAAGGAVHRARGQVVELVLGRKVGVHRRRIAPRHRRQAVIGLRAHDQIDERHPADDLVPFGLRHAARNPDLEVRAPGFERFQPAQVRIQLFRRLFPDVAGVQQHHVRVVGTVGFHIPFGAHRLGHALAVIDVHLAAIGLDEKPLRRLFGHRDVPGNCGVIQEDGRVWKRRG